jgi:hypothetical protein
MMNAAEVDTIVDVVLDRLAARAGLSDWPSEIAQLFLMVAAPARDDPLVSDVERVHAEALLDHLGIVDARQLAEMPIDPNRLALVAGVRRGLLSRAPAGCGAYLWCVD